MSLFARPSRPPQEAGHGGASGRFDRLEEVALIYAFALEAAEGFREPRPAGRPPRTP